MFPNRVGPCSAQMITNVHQAEQMELQGVACILQGQLK